MCAGLRKRDIGYEAKTVNFTTIHWGVLRQWQQDESVRQGHAMRVSIQNEKLIESQLLQKSIELDRSSESAS